MDIRDVQTELARLGLYEARVDGKTGRATRDAISILLSRQTPPPAYLAWPDARRLIAAEQAIYEAAGIDVGTIDGLVGPQTRYAREIWAARATGDQSVETWRDAEAGAPAAVPAVARASWPTLAEVRTGKSVFGAAGGRQATIQLPYPMRLAWDLNTSVTRMSCHELVAAPLDTIWRETLTHYGVDRIKALRLDLFGGSYNYRKSRGSNNLSAHAWGIAVDMDPERNALKMTAKEAAFDGPEYDAWWRIVESTGAVSLGRTKNYDWMHFQFCR